MSRCRSCDKIMSPYEMSRKYAGTTEYVDLCNSCFDGLDIATIQNEGLSKFADIDAAGAESPWDEEQFDPEEDGYPWEERE